MVSIMIEKDRMRKESARRRGTDCSPWCPGQYVAVIFPDALLTPIFSPLCSSLCPPSVARSKPTTFFVFLLPSRALHFNSVPGHSAPQAGHWGALLLQTLDVSVCPLLLHTEIQWFLMSILLGLWQGVGCIWLGFTFAGKPRTWATSLTIVLPFRTTRSRYEDNTAFFKDTFMKRKMLTYTSMRGLRAAVSWSLSSAAHLWLCQRLSSYCCICPHTAVCVSYSTTLPITRIQLRTRCRRPPMVPTLSARYTNLSPNKFKPSIFWPPCKPLDWTRHESWAPVSCKIPCLSVCSSNFYHPSTLFVCFSSFDRYCSSSFISASMNLSSISHANLEHGCKYATTMTE
jgi:hypothetical protein